MNRARVIQGSSCLFAAGAVIFGAFGAHFLKDQLSDRSLEVFHTGVTYQFWHAMGLWLAGDAVRTGRPGGIASLFFAVGIILFSGSLYTMAISGETWLGAVTPIGGVCFIIGWALLARAVLHAKH